MAVLKAVQEGAHMEARQAPVHEEVLSKGGCQDVCAQPPRCACAQYHRDHRGARRGELHEASAELQHATSVRQAPCSVVRIRRTHDQAWGSSCKESGVSEH